MSMTQPASMADPSSGPHPQHFHYQGGPGGAVGNQAMHSSMMVGPSAVGPPEATVMSPSMMSHPHAQHHSF